MFKFRWCCLAAATVVLFATGANAATLDYFYGTTPQGFGPWAMTDPLRTQNVSFSSQVSPYTVVTSGMPFQGYVEPSTYTPYSSGPAYVPVAAPDAGTAAMTSGMGGSYSGSSFSSAWTSPIASNPSSSAFTNLYTGSLAPVNISWQALDVPVAASGLSFNGMSWGSSGPAPVTVNLGLKPVSFSPEPSSWALLATGAAALAYLRKRRATS